MGQTQILIYVYVWLIMTHFARKLWQSITLLGVVEIKTIYREWHKSVGKHCCEAHLSIVIITML